MSEPVMRRTQSGLAPNLARKSALRVHSPLAKALSLCSVLSILAFAAAPLQAETSAAADAGYAIESPKAVHSLLLDVVNTGERLVAVGDRGHILYSNDQGQSWQQAKVPTRQMLTSLFFVDAKHGWVVGHDAQILATADGGLTWTKQFEDLEREAPLLDIWFKDLQTGYAVGAYGALLETTDGGQNWEDVSDRLDNEDAYHLNAITAVKDSGLFIVGELGQMFRSADWGQTWNASRTCLTRGRCLACSAPTSPLPCWPTVCVATCSAPLTSVTAGNRSSSIPRTMARWSSVWPMARC